MSHPDPLFDPDNSYEDDIMDNEEVYEMDGVECGHEDGYEDDSNYDDHDDFYGESTDYSDYNDDRDYDDENSGEVDWDYNDDMDGDHDSAMDSIGWGDDDSLAYGGGENDYGDW